MRTLDRDSQTLNVGYMTDQMARLSFEARWDVRLVDMAGTPLTAANWLKYQIPESAIVGRTRSGSIDGGPWYCTLSLIANLLPAGVAPLQYHRIEIDRVIGPTPPNRWPYFTGIIDKVTIGFVLQDGAILKTYEIECFGVLQRCKGRRISSISAKPASTNYTTRLMGVLERVRIRTDAVVGAGGTEQVPAGPCYALTDATIAAGNYGLMISPNADMSAPYANPADYTLSVTAMPATITWVANPAEPRYMQFYRLAFFGYSKATASPPLFFRLPYGRGPYNLFMTQVSAYATGPVRITPKDPTAYKSGAGLVKNTTDVQTEYLTLTDSDGTESTVEISSVDAAGIITLTGAPSFTPVAGDPIRVSTCEMYNAWDQIGYRNATGFYYQSRIFEDSLTTLNGAITDVATSIVVADGTKLRVGQFILIESEVIQISAIAVNTLTAIRGQDGTSIAAHADTTKVYGEGKRGAYKTAPESGCAIRKSSKNFSTTDEVKGRISVVNEYEGASSQNDVAAFIKSTLIALGLYATADITATSTGAYIKNYDRDAIDASEVLDDIKKNALPPNGYLCDERDGTITIKPYSQATTHDFVLNGVSAIHQEALAEPTSAVTVISTGPEENWAAKWFTSYNGGWTNPQNIVDGSDSEAVQTSIGTPPIVSFTIPGHTPLEIFPMIDRIEIVGRGYVTVYITQTTAGRAHLRDWSNRPLNDAQPWEKGAVTITGAELATAMGGQTESTDIKISFEFGAADDDDSGQTAAACTEIRIWVKRKAAWRAAITDDSAADGTYGAAPSGWTPTDTTQIGTIWWQPTPLKAESFRYAPPALTKRILTIWNAARGSQVYRNELIEVDGINAQDCRDMAERYMDEYVRQSATYHITAPLDDRAERGDTMLVRCPAGQTFSDGTTTKNLLLWAIEDGGGAEDNMAQYTAVDYGA